MLSQTLYANRYSKQRPPIPIVTSCPLLTSTFTQPQCISDPARDGCSPANMARWRVGTLTLMCLHQGHREEGYIDLRAGRSRAALHRNMS